MIFGSRNKGQRLRSPALSEEEIRNRLYGSAVGITADAREADSKKRREREKQSVPQKTRLLEERNRIQEEIQLLKKDLEKTRNKLYRMRGIRTKKLRLLAVYLIIFLAAAVLAAIIIRQFLFVSKGAGRTITAESPTAAKPQGPYSIQVAVYGNSADAQKFSSLLNSRGYDTFVEESRFKSGKARFKVYVGGFKDKESAARALNRLRETEGIKDSFITSLPE